MSFVHLHVRTQFSLLQGMIRIPGLIQAAKDMSMPAVAMTDTANLFGAFEFYQKAKGQDLRPILGVELAVAFGDEPKQASFPSLVFLAENALGLKNLFTLTSLAHFNQDHDEPVISFEQLTTHSDGLICLTGSLRGPLSQALVHEQVSLASSRLDALLGFFGQNNLFVELFGMNQGSTKRINATLNDLAQKANVDVVACNDCHYLNSSDARAQDILSSIGQGKSVYDDDRDKLDGDRYHFASPEEMAEAFSMYPGATERTLAIAERCNVDFTLGTYHMPNYEMAEGETFDSALEKLSRDGLEKRWGQIELFHKRRDQFSPDLKKTYLARLEEELEIIRSMGYSAYFLIVADFIMYAKTHEIPVGPGRGSAAGSLVAYATQITDVDPIAYHLLFERFLNPERISMPDIDVDFCQDGRDQVIRYVGDKYGDLSQGLEQTRVGQITTFGKMQAKAVIRDVGRALGFAYNEVDTLAKMVPNVLNISLEEAFQSEEGFDDIRSNSQEVDELLNVALELEGLPRHASVHAAGVVISDENPLVHHVPMMRGQHGEAVTQWDMKGVENIGLVKFDFLGLKTLTLLQKSVDLVQKNKDQAINLLEIDMDDPKVYELLKRGETQGIFQLESSGMRDLVVRLKPSCFEDLIALVALYRPGPLGSGMVDDFIHRKHGVTKIVYDLPELEPILNETYGVILYQEQVMQIASTLASYSLGEADLLRRAMGKKIPAEMAKQEARFLSGCEKNGFAPNTSKKIFDLMEKFAGYGFNKSHSAAYAMISYQTAYMKAHHPIAFMAACLTIDRNNSDRVAKLLSDVRRQGIEILPPDVNESAKDFDTVDGGIRFGLGAIKNVGDGAIESIVESRRADGPFKDLLDFSTRISLRQVNKKVFESLTKAGAFDRLHKERSEVYASIGSAMDAATAKQREAESGQNQLFGAGANITWSYQEEKPWPNEERLRFEKDVLGLYLSGHPLSSHAALIERFSEAEASELSDKRKGDILGFAGMLVGIKQIQTKKGDRMAFLTLEDLSGEVEVIAFPDCFASAKTYLTKDTPLYVIGELDISSDQAKILAQEIHPLESAAEHYKGRAVMSLNADQVSVEALEALAEAVRTHPGPVSLSLNLNLASRSSVRISAGKKFGIKPSSELEAAVETALGQTPSWTFTSGFKGKAPKGNGQRFRRKQAS